MKKHGTFKVPCFLYSDLLFAEQKNAKGKQCSARNPQSVYGIVTGFGGGREHDLFFIGNLKISAARNLPTIGYFCKFYGVGAVVKIRIESAIAINNRRVIG